MALMAKEKIVSVGITQTFSDSAQKEAVENNTWNLVQALVGAPPFFLEQKTKLFQQMIAEGKVDCDAYVCTQGRTGPQDLQYMQLPEFLLRHGVWGSDNIYPMILHHAKSMKHESQKSREILVKAIGINNPNYLSAFLAHPLVDINAPISDGDHTVLEACMAVLHGGDGTGELTLWNPQQAQLYAQQLLERGAVMSRICFLILHYTPSGLAYAAPYETQWEKEWKAFESGALSCDAVTSTQLGHFYTLGHLEDAMQPARWTGHEAQGLMLYSELPKWVQKEYPCVSEHYALASRIQPEPLVAGWSVDRQGQYCAAVPARGGNR